MYVCVVSRPPVTLCGGVSRKRQWMDGWMVEGWMVEGWEDIYIHMCVCVWMDG